jgi:hypothetical protein
VDYCNGTPSEVWGDKGFIRGVNEPKEVTRHTEMIERTYYMPAIENKTDFSKDGIHCDGECPHLKPYGDERAFSAKCDLTGADLMWHDYWIAGECHQETVKENKDEN